MKSILFSLVIVVLFIGCGKYEPKLPQSYDDVSFAELMELLDVENINIDKDTILYKTDELNIDSRLYGLDFDFNEPMKSFCTSKKGKYNILTNEFLPNFLKNEIQQKKTGFSFCEKEKKVIFGIFKTKLNNEWQAYPRYVYYFVKSIHLTSEVNIALENRKQDQEQYKDDLKRNQEEAKLKKLIEEQYLVNKEKLDYMFVEKFHEPSTGQLKNGYVETKTFSTIDRYEFKHHYRNIPDVIFHKQCDKVCSQYNHNLKDILDGNPTLVNKKPFTKIIATQAKYGMYNFDVSCICFGNKYRIKEYIWNER